MEYIVSGHSGHTTELIAVPRNVTVIFYAKKGETCYIPYNVESLNFVMSEMKMPTHREIYVYGDRVNNYAIHFEDNIYQGIFHLVNSTYYTVPSQENVTLRDIFQFLQQDGSPKTLYCMFCRGSQADEFRLQAANIAVPDNLDANFDNEIADLLDVLSNASLTPEPEPVAEPDILGSPPTTPILNAGPVAEANMPAKRKSPKKSKSRKIQKHKAKKATRKTKKSNTKSESKSK